MCNFFPPFTNCGSFNKKKKRGLKEPEEIQKPTIVEGSIQRSSNSVVQIKVSAPVETEIRNVKPVLNEDPSLMGPEDSKQINNSREAVANTHQDNMLSDDCDESIHSVGRNKKNNDVTDINRKYREMEEEVARRVRETMELADAKRKALKLENQTKQLNAKETAETKTLVENLQGSPIKIGTERKPEQAAHNVDGFEGPVLFNEVNQREETQNIDKLENSISENMDEDSPNLQEQIMQIGFEQFESIFDNELKLEGAQSLAAMNISSKLHDFPDINSKNVQAENEVENTQTINKLRNPHERQLRFESDRHGTSSSNTVTTAGGIDEQLLDDSNFSQNSAIMYGALNIAQNAARNIDMSHESTHSKKYEPGESISTQNVGWNVDSFQDSSDTEKWELAKGALHLAQTASNNINNFPRTLDDEEFANSSKSNALTIDGQSYDAAAITREYAEGSLNLPQNASRNISNNLRTSIDDEELLEGKRNLAQSNAHDTDEITLTRELAEGALTLAQNASRNINFHSSVDVEETGSFGGIQNLAQRSASNFSAGNITREIGEGALNLAQDAAKKIVQDAPEGTNEIGQQRKETLQIGFESFDAPRVTEDDLDKELRNPTQLLDANTKDLKQEFL